MKVKYDLNGQIYEFNQTDSDEAKKLNFLLSNNKGDFLNLGVSGNTCKFHGLNFCNSKTLDIFKVIDEILPLGLEVCEVEYSGATVERKFKSKFSESVSIPVVEEIKSDTFGDDGDLEYDEQGVLRERVEEEVEMKAKDKFYLGPTGGMIYEIFNFEGEVSIDLDMKKQNDYSKWGREYQTYKKNDHVFVKYKKVNEEDGSKYEFYLGIKAVNFSYDMINEWTRKEYFYSKLRSAEFEEYVYRLMKVKIMSSKRIIIGYGLSEDEVVSQIDLLEKHQDELENFDKNISSDLIVDCDFEKPISQDVSLAYKLSKNAIYKFLNKNLEKGNLKEGAFAGFPWFANVWTRDDLVGLRAFINNGEDAFVKERLYYYLDLIDFNEGVLPRIEQPGSLGSPDSVFWLAKRFIDFIFYLEEKDSLKKVFSMNELNMIYAKLHSAFNKITEKFWDKENELIKVKNGDSWMDTINVNFPLDIQVQYLEFVSSLAILASLLGRKDDATMFLDLEDSMAGKIRQTYYRNSRLFAEAFEDRVSSNVFLTYYIYPDLFLQKTWEIIFDNALKELLTSWGGISSLSKKDSRFQANYTGENNMSYHNGDSWFWINNIAALAMDDLNEQKYRGNIRKILISSTRDILKMGTIGFASEISSASALKSEGCQAQFWSSSTYIEMVEKIFKRL